MAESAFAGARYRTFSTGRLLVLAGLLCAVACAALLSLVIGARPISSNTILTAFTAYDPTDFDHQALFLFRLPRLIAAILVGGALALTGALMQAVIRNPLAEPQLLGLNAGAALAVVATSAAGLDVAGLTRPAIAALGAFASFAIVLALSGIGRSGATPLKVTLSGVIVSAFAASVTSALLLIDDQALQDLRLWLAGDLAGRSSDNLAITAPVSVAGTVAAFLLAPRLSALALGDEVARGLGINVKRTRLAALSIAAILSGTAVTLAGPIGFIGLIVPHLVRRIMGENIRLQFLACLLGGPVLLLVADMLARRLIAPAEIATGVITGAVGALFFIILVARHFR
ncbi:FecCD family ABC transporter permease [Aliirhizobium smilacinae]|uniref:Iron ABC transporter permease n=1 Tax=Aliirhizobium smilacinae TaxID=1395944 RepID=A0A5C4XK57_9HYPH|nr:iron ABC transporter permease [Rhizobium smilacinae]TNM63589.1 iron ABC transporter permease [Rhizobium smilacinae]